MKISIVAFVLLAVGITSCNVVDLPVTSSGRSAYGLLSEKNMCDYYYPKQAGWTYVYQNSLEELTASGAKILGAVAGPQDTVRTLGFQGFSPSGDSLFAFDVTYRVAMSYSEKRPMTLYYVKTGNSHNGGFIVGNNKAGYATGTIDSITVSPAAIDTILYAVDGPLRDLLDGYNPSGQYLVRKDRIFFSSHEDSVELWYREGGFQNAGPLRRVRQLWYKDFDKNDDWQYSMWEHYTYFKVRDEDVTIPTPAGPIPSAEIEVVTEDLSTPVKEFKYWGKGVGLVRQADEWRATTDGANFKMRRKTRDLLSRTLNGVPVVQ